jgi:hypothetical protein
MVMDFNPTSVEEVQTEYSKRLKPRQFLMLNWRCDLEDMQAASRLGERCGMLLVAILHRRNITRSDEVTLPTSYLAKWGISRTSKLRALQTLETAKLIRVKREPGHTSVVQLVSRKRKSRRGNHDPRSVPKLTTQKNG